MRHDVPRDYDEFYTLYRPVVLRVIRRVSRCKVRREDRDDLMQHIFLIALHRRWLERFTPGRAQFGTYITTLVHNALVNAYRSNGRKPLNNPHSLLEPRVDITRRKLPPHTLDPEVSKATAEYFKDELFEARLLSGLELDRFCAAVAATTHAHTDLRCTVIRLMGEGCTVPEMAARTGAPASRIIQARRALRAFARAR